MSYWETAARLGLGIISGLGVAATLLFAYIAFEEDELWAWPVSIIMAIATVLVLSGALSSW